ncbi:hypothetical protein ANCDUO_12051 [Ancylostoma duodenale]|uniref:Uncharacterized protein n=1 Tax=Ancylostoma duodenale TaxID=51022 RepID=A0A0C2G9V6_9BILA|nr:hypothetical protein ANCDUO_12051 [Ancylostoma duodenale]
MKWDHASENDECITQTPDENVQLLTGVARVKDFVHNLRKEVEVLLDMGSLISLSFVETWPKNFDLCATHGRILGYLPLVPKNLSH